MTYQTAGWQACAASARGSKHERQQQPNQDAVGYRITQDGIIIAISDGAGSAPLSHLGAQTAVNTALDSLLQDENACLPQALANAMHTARDAVIALATDQCSARHYAATLSLAVVRDQQMAAAQTGDGAVAYAGADGQYRLLTSPTKGEYANETEFLTSPHWLMPPVLIADGPVTRVLATTDGMLELGMERMPDGCYRPHPPFHDTLFRWLEAQNQPGLDSYLQLRRLLQSPKTRARTDDDVTLAIASLPAARTPS